MTVRELLAELQELVSSGNVTENDQIRIALTDHDRRWIRMILLETKTSGRFTDTRIVLSPSKYSAED